MEGRDQGSKGRGIKETSGDRIRIETGEPGNRRGTKVRLGRKGIRSGEKDREGREQKQEGERGVGGNR